MAEKTTEKKERYSLYLPQNLIDRIDAVVAEYSTGFFKASRNQVAALILEKGLPIVEEGSKRLNDPQLTE